MGESGGAQAVTTQRRLNPFAFPAETNVRFTMLVVTALMLAIHLSSLFLGGWAEPSTLYTGGISPELGDDAFVAQSRAALGEGLAETARYLVLFAVFSAGIFGMATLIYRRHPARIRRRKQLHPLPEDKDPAFTAAVRSLTDRAEIAPPPSIEIADGSQLTDGQAFGTRGRYALRLGGRMPLLMRKRPALFQATVLHELAHITNRDVGRTYFTQSLWAAVLLLAILPLITYAAVTFAGAVGRRLIATVGSGTADWLTLLTVNIPAMSILVIQIAGTLGLFALLRSSVLRVREVYADWQAALWGAEEGLVAILKRGAAGERHSQWGRLWRLHPTAGERLAALNDPARLFRVTLEIPLIAGVLLATALAGTIQVALQLGLGAGLAVMNGALIAAERSLSAQAGGGILALLAFLLVILVTPVVLVASLAPVAGTAYLVAGTLGLQVQREAVADMADGRRHGFVPYLRLATPALLFALGFQIGLLITPANPLNPANLLIGYEGSLLPVLLLPFEIGVWVVGVTVLAWLSLVYTRFFAQRVLGTHTGETPPRGKRRLLTLVSSVLTGALILPAVTAQAMVMETLTGGQIIKPEWLFVMLIVTAMIYGGAFAASWLLAGPGSGKRRCPACDHRTRQRTTACEHCGAELAPWLFVDTPVGMGGD